MTQQFLHRPEEALKEARLAEGVCKARLAELKAQNVRSFLPKIRVKVLGFRVLSVEF